MKKILALVLAALMLFAFAACENTNDEPAETDAPATDAPETDAPETDVPETDAPESGDTDTAYTQMDFMTEDLSKYIKLGQYKGLELAVERPTVTEEEIDYEIQAVIAELTKYEEYEEPVTDRATEKYDNLNIDFVGFMDGELFEGGSAEGATVVLAEDNGYLDWFDDDLYGVMPGTTVTTTNFFPEDAIESLAGKEVTFEITVNYIEGHYTVPEFTDEFIAENTEFNSVAEFKELVRLTIQSEKDAKFEEEKFNILFGAIIDNAEIIEYPEEQIMYYYTSEISYLEAYAANYGVTIDVLMEAQGIEFPPEAKCDLYIASMGENATLKASQIAADVRGNGMHAQFDIVGRSIKAQMKYANKIGAAYTVVLGDSEIEAGVAKVKNMADGSETEMNIDDIAEEIMRLSINDSLKGFEVEGLDIASLM